MGALNVSGARRGNARCRPVLLRWLWRATGQRLPPRRVACTQPGWRHRGSGVSGRGRRAGSHGWWTCAGAGTRGGGRI